MTAPYFLHSLWKSQGIHAAYTSIIWQAFNVDHPVYTFMKQTSLTHHYISPVYLYKELGTWTYFILGIEANRTLFLLGETGDPTPLEI